VQEYPLIVVFKPEKRGEVAKAIENVKIMREFSIIPAYVVRFSKTGGLQIAGKRCSGKDLARLQGSHPRVIILWGFKPIPVYDTVVFNTSPFQNLLATY